MSGSVLSQPGPPCVRQTYVLAGDSIAIPPSGAWLTTGMMIPAQPELKVPMMPTTLSFAAYAFAFCEHLPESHLPAWAVASSQDW